jgi:hypothetical protein
MMQRTFITAAVLAALIGPANSTEIGTIVWFNKSLTVMGGCTDLDDAKRLDSFGTDVWNEWKIVRYVEMNNLGFENGRPQGCVILNRDPQERWKVVNKISAGEPTSAWFCVESTVRYRADFSIEGKPQTNSYENKIPCFWIRLLDKRDRQ